MTFDRIGWFRAAAAEAREDGLPEDSVDQLAILVALTDDTGYTEFDEFRRAIGKGPSVLPWAFLRHKGRARPSTA